MLCTMNVVSEQDRKTAKDLALSALMNGIMMGDKRLLTIASKNFETFAKADAEKDDLITGEVLDSKDNIVTYTLASNGKKSSLNSPSYAFHQNFSSEIKKIKLPTKDKSAISAAAGLTCFSLFSVGLSIIFFGVSKLFGSDFSFLQTSAALTGYFLLTTKQSGLKDIKNLFNAGKMYLDGRSTIKKSSIYTP